MIGWSRGQVASAVASVVVVLFRKKFDSYYFRVFAATCSVEPRGVWGGCPSMALCFQGTLIERHIWGPMNRPLHAIRD